MKTIAKHRENGKKNNIIINAEGVGDTSKMAKRIQAISGIHVRATILSYIQRGGTPTCRDRVYASVMGAKAVDLLCEGKSNRIVAYKNGNFVDFDDCALLNCVIKLNKNLAENPCCAKKVPD